MREFLRLQFKLKWGWNRNNDKKSAWMTALAVLFVVFIGLALVAALTWVLRSSIRPEPRSLAALYLTVVLAGLTVFATGMQVGRLYRPADLLITARFPLSPFKLFLSNLILTYCDLLIWSAVLCLPIFLVFGLTLGTLSFVYFLGIIVLILAMPMIPFALSCFLAIPVMLIIGFLERNGTVRLCLFVVLLAAGFAAYYELLSVLAQFFIHRNWEEGTLEIWRAVLTALDGPWSPSHYLANLMFFDGFGIGVGIVVGGSAVLSAGGVALARVLFSKVRRAALEGSRAGYPKPTALDGLNSGRAIFRYSLKEILRTRTYSYFYLGVAISTPVMVFFCNRLVTMVGEAEIGRGIGFGASILVVAVFMAMICSFAGTVLSVEGKTFYITKLIPVSFRKQLLVKGFLHIGVSAGALLISVAVLAALEFLNAEEIASLVATMLCLATGLVFNGINLNVRLPNLKPKANGEAEEINIGWCLLIGLFFAAILGAGCILLPRLSETGRLLAFLLPVACTAVYAAANFLLFWFTVDRKYRNIEA